MTTEKPALLEPSNWITIPFIFGMLAYWNASDAKSMLSSFTEIEHILCKTTQMAESSDVPKYCSEEALYPWKNCLPLWQHLESICTIVSNLLPLLKWLYSSWEGPSVGFVCISGFTTHHILPEFLTVYTTLGVKVRR